jgi:hypothetical protein
LSPDLQKSGERYEKKIETSESVGSIGIMLSGNMLGEFDSPAVGVCAAAKAKKKSKDQGSTAPGAPPTPNHFKKK